MSCGWCKQPAATPGLNDRGERCPCRCHPPKCRHWQVFSPEMSSRWSQYEPVEYFRCFTIVEANTKRAALIAAVAHPDFKEWVPPFKGLEASRCVCEHGVCWGCVDYCDTCVAEHDADFLAEMAAAEAP